MVGTFLRHSVDCTYVTLAVGAISVVAELLVIFTIGHVGLVVGLRVTHFATKQAY